MLGRAFKIATVQGIPLLVHWTFGFFFLWIAFVGYQAGMDQQGIFRLCLFAAVLFVCVVLHEFGHALTARRYGIQTKDIIISPIGGVARLFRMPKKPLQELFIAFAGPLVNLIIAVFLGTVLTLFTKRGIIPEGDPARIFNDPQNFLPALFWVNILLIVFNLVPAFPMDGGRVFRALLSMRWGRVRATKIAARLGQFIAVCFVFYGLWDWDLILVFIGLFVFMSAASEYRSVYMDALLSERTAADLYRTNYSLLDQEDLISRAIAIQEDGREHDFLVVDKMNNILGALSSESIQKAKELSDHQAPISKYMTDQIQSVDVRAPLKHIFNLLQKENAPILPVLDLNGLAGVVDRRLLHNYLREQMRLHRNWNKQSVKTSSSAKIST